MNIYLRPSTSGKSGGYLNGHLKFFYKLVQQELEKAGFQCSFDELTIVLTYPPARRASLSSMEKTFLEYYATLPQSRLDRRNKRIEVSVQAPEFSPHYNKVKQAEGKEPPHIPETTLAHLLIDKILEALNTLQPKLKKQDSFDRALFEKVLSQIKNKISPEYLRAQSSMLNKADKQDTIHHAELKRLERQSQDLPKDKLIRDIRLFYAYTLPDSLFYLNRYADLVLQRLIAKDFRCPVYHHLYISIAGTREEALRQTYVLEDWFTFGIAVLKKEDLLNADMERKQLLVLAAIRDGLMDIATLDNLDTDMVLDAVQEAREAGLFTETIFKAKENKKIAFVITTRPIPGKNREEIYFTLTDKQSNRTAKWKFGEENIHVIGGWFGTLTVTNKVVRTKPRANMELVLKGKEMFLEIDVEAALSDPGKVR